MGERTAGGREVARGRLALLRCLGHAGPARASLLLVVLAVVALMPAAFAVAVGYLVTSVPDAVEAGFGSDPGRRLVFAIALVAALLLLERVLAPVNEVVRWTVARRVDGALRERVLDAIEAPREISHLEEAALQDQLGLLKGGLFGTVGTASVAAAGILGRYLQTFATLAIVAWYSLPLALFVLAVLVVIRIRWHRSFGTLASAITTSGRELRQVGYTVDLAIAPPAAKEVRIFGLLDWLVDRATTAWAAATAEPFEVRRRLRASANLELALLGLAYLVTFVVVTRAAIDGSISLGVVAAVLQASFTAAELISPGTDDFATPAGLAGLDAIHAVIAATESTPDGPAATQPADGLPTREICFEQVGFTYPGSDRPVLDGLDLRIGAGESLALVGLNGAGKTTLVKLLTGLYRPTTGRITVDGTDLAALDVASWRRSVGVIFQDFVHYDLPLRDNVAVRGDGVDDLALGRALATAGAGELVDRLPGGADTVLSRQYEGGAELSGGQWQRVALARALYAVETGARVLVLDEPTANLDVRAEAALFDSFLRWTSSAASVLISHRFSTVRRASRIVVLSGGRIVESGSHEELLALDGEYAAMFRVQALQFSTTAPDAGERDEAATDA